MGVRLYFDLEREDYSFFVAPRGELEKALQLVDGYRDAGHGNQEESYNLFCEIQDNPLANRISSWEIYGLGKAGLSVIASLIEEFQGEELDCCGHISADTPEGQEFQEKVIHRLKASGLLPMENYHLPTLILRSKGISWN